MDEVRLETSNRVPDVTQARPGDPVVGIGRKVDVGELDDSIGPADVVGSERRKDPKVYVARFERREESRERSGDAVDQRVQAFRKVCDLHVVSTPCREARNLIYRSGR
jgi:hypothetical protein